MMKNSQENITGGIKKKMRLKAVKDKVTKIKKNPGRKKVIDKKKPRILFYNNAEFQIIENLAEKIGIDARSFMLMCINQKVKMLLKTENLENLL